MVKRSTPGYHWLWRVTSRYLSGSYSIADMAVWPWVSGFEWKSISLDDFPQVRRWNEQFAAKLAVQRGYDQPLFMLDIPMP